LALGFLLRLFGMRDARTRTAAGEWLGGEQQL
jgi:hypothetical protein